MRTLSIGYAERTNYVHTFIGSRQQNARFESYVAPNPIPAGWAGPSLNISAQLLVHVCHDGARTSSSLGWGSTVIGGTYSETISGLHKAALTVTVRSNSAA